MGGTVIRFKNKSKAVNNARRRRTGHTRKCDIEDPYHIGHKDNFPCRNCGSPTKPYKQDAMGDIIVSCTNPHCILNIDVFGSNNMNVKLSKLLKEQMLHSRYYVDYFGSTYGEHYNPWRKNKLLF